MRTGQSDIDLVSGEAVHLDVRLATAGSRTLALVFDIMVQFLLLGILMIMLGIGSLLTGLMDGGYATAAVIAIMVIVFVVYPTLVHSLSRGRSLGKLIFGLRLVRDDGGPITLRHSFTRALVGTTLEWPGMLLPVSWLMSLATMIGSRHGKRIADLAAGTIVIHERSPEAWGWTPAIPQPLLSWAATLDLTGLDDQLALAARHFLSRSRHLREPHRTRVGEALATELMAVVTPPPPIGVPGWAYLAAVVGERHRRAALRLAKERASQVSLWPELFRTPQPATFVRVPVQSTTTAPARMTSPEPLRPAAPGPRIQ